MLIVNQTTELKQNKQQWFYLFFKKSITAEEIWRKYTGLHFFLPTVVAMDSDKRSLPGLTVRNLFLVSTRGGGVLKYSTAPCPTRGNLCQWEHRKDWAMISISSPSPDAAVEIFHYRLTHRRAACLPVRVFEKEEAYNFQQDASYLKPPFLSRSLWGGPLNSL